ncbi:MAG: hypothetical protein ACI37U_00960 [Bacteroides sp.]
MNSSIVRCRLPPPQRAEQGDSTGHFLFNSPNTLIAGIKYNPENGVNFTLKAHSSFKGKSLISEGKAATFRLWLNY